MHFSMQLKLERSAVMVGGEILPQKGLPPRGIEFLISMCANSHVPVYAIGGIMADKFPEQKRSEAAGACIMSAAMKL